MISGPKPDKVVDAAVPEHSASSIPRPLNNTGNFRVLGDLILPHPSTCGLLKEHEELVLGLQPHLDRMHARDLSSKADPQEGRDIADIVSEIPKPIQALKQAFEIFKVRETKIWKDLGLEPPHRDGFVGPSGLLNAGVMHHLNQPSYSTLNHVDGEIADTSNGCIAMLMGNAFKKNETLIFDDLRRRSKKSESYETYPQEVIDCHVSWTQDICASATAKVEIMYGIHVQKRVLQRWAITILPLWGALCDVFLFLVHESNFSNPDETYRFRRVVLFACHPQRLYYEPAGSDLARLQDSITSTATKIAKDGTPCIKDYFLKKKWRDGSDLWRQIEIKALGTTLEKTFDTLQYVDKTKGSKDNALAAQSVTEEEGWGRYFSSNPYSNDDLRHLLPSALQAIDDHRDEQWNDPSDFPEAVREWFRGQKQILFYEFCIHGTSDIAKVFEASYMPIKAELSTFSLQDMLRCMMLQQTLILEKVKGKKLDLYHS